MDDDLLNRDAINRNLHRITNERMEGRKLVGVKYDEHSKSWSIVGSGSSKEVHGHSLPHRKK